MEKWKSKMSKVQMARRGDFLYGKPEEQNVQSVVG